MESVLRKPEGSHSTRWLLRGPSREDSDWPFTWDGAGREAAPPAAGDGAWGLGRPGGGTRQRPQRGRAPRWQRRLSREPRAPRPQALAAAEKGEGLLRQLGSRWRGSGGLPSSPTWHGAHTEPTAQGQTQPTPPQAPQVLRGTVHLDQRAALAHGSQDGSCGTGPSRGPLPGVWG